MTAIPKGKKSNRREKRTRVREKREKPEQFQRKPYSDSRTFHAWHAQFVANLRALIESDSPHWRKGFGRRFFIEYELAGLMHRDSAREAARSAA